jgi:hypothetical protein
MIDNNYILLLGAGFSRNWGGWLADEVFEYLLGCNEIYSDDYLRNKLWNCKEEKDGFETALEKIQKESKNDPSKTISLKRFNKCLLDMFESMNKSFVPNNFARDNAISSIIEQIEPLLAKFNAIFTLNQDLLLETVYTPPALGVNRNNSWSGVYLPGMQATREEAGVVEQGQFFLWKRQNEASFRSNRNNCEALSPNNKPFELLDKTYQPYFKLHGSCNWKGQEDNNLLIMGGGKGDEIKLHPILDWYQEKFTEYLSKTNTRVMIIGYGFEDNHINAQLIEAAKKGNLKLYIVNPCGVDVVLEKAKDLNPYLIGASRRSLRDSFSSDLIEREKIMSAPRKVRKNQLVRIQPMQSLTNSIEATIALQEVTNVMKPIEATYQAATQVKVLSSEIPENIEADVFHCAEGSMKGRAIA